jgi:hypothetical protein
VAAYSLQMMNASCLKLGMFCLHVLGVYAGVHVDPQATKAQLIAELIPRGPM